MDDDLGDGPHRVGRAHALVAPGEGVARRDDQVDLVDPGQRRAREAAGVEHEADRVTGPWADLAHGGFAGGRQQVAQDRVAQDILQAAARDLLSMQ